MSFERILVETTGMLITFGVPVIIIAYPKLPRWPRSPVGRFVIAILFVWLLLIIHRMVSLPTLIRDAHAAGNMEYDGVGGNVGTLFFGWFVAAFGCIPALIISEIITFFTKKKNKSIIQTSKNIAEAEQAGDGNADGRV
jgi:uncharacterized membrane protein